MTSWPQARLNDPKRIPASYDVNASPPCTSTHLIFAHRRHISTSWPRAHLDDPERTLASCVVDASPHRASPMHLDSAVLSVSRRPEVHHSFMRCQRISTLHHDIPRFHAMMLHRRQILTSRPRARLDYPECIPSTCDLEGSPPRASTHLGFANHQRISTLRPRACVYDPERIPYSCDVHASQPRASTHLGFT